MISYGDIKSGEAALPAGESVRDLDLDLSQIKVDQSAQPRESLNNDRIAEYAGAMKAGDQFPPLTVFHDGETYWLADGFHRHYAAQHAGRKHVRCYVRQGGLRDAILWSVGANAKHGLARTDEDKRRAVARLLADEEWSQWSDREIARRCRVSDKFVAKQRPPVSADHPQIERKVQRGGTVYTQKVAKAKPAVVAENAPTEVTTQEFSIFKASEPEAVVESTTPEDHQFEELQRAWNAAGEGARARFLAANNLQFTDEPEAAAEVAGDYLREPTAAASGQIIREGDAPRETDRESGDASCPDTDFSSAPPAEAAPASPSPPTPAGAADNSHRWSKLRPHCLTPECCAGVGREHCHACKRAMADREAA